MPTDSNKSNRDDNIEKLEKLDQNNEIDLKLEISNEDDKEAKVCDLDAHDEASKKEKEVEVAENMAVNIIDIKHVYEMEFEDGEYTGSVLDGLPHGEGELVEWWCSFKGK